MNMNINHIIVIIIIITIDDWKRVTSKLDELFGLNVKSFYNPTSGMWVSDLTRAGYQLALKPNDLVTAKLLGILLLILSIICLIIIIMV